MKEFDIIHSKLPLKDLELDVLNNYLKYRKQIFFYILPPLIKELERNKIYFQFSKDINDMSLKEILNEIIKCCEEHGINQELRHELILKHHERKVTKNGM